MSRDMCSDPERAWYPQRTICFATMASAAANWMYDSLHEAKPYHDGTFESFSAKRSESHPFHVRDGVTVWVSEHDLTPDDEFLGALGPEGEPYKQGDQ